MLSVDFHTSQCSSCATLVIRPRRPTLGRQDRDRPITAVGRFLLCLHYSTFFASHVKPQRFLLLPHKYSYDMRFVMLS